MAIAGNSREPTCRHRRETVAVVTDSAASLPAGALAALGIAVVPMTLVLDGAERPDSTSEVIEVAGRVRRGDLVSTSAPSPGQFLAAAKNADGRPVLIATVGSALSASHGAAQAAAGYLPAGRVAVVDTGTAAGGQGLVVLAAAQAAARGEQLDHVAATARRAARHVRLVAALGDLGPLARSGRVPVIAARAGRSLGIRPLFELVNGEAKIRRPGLGWHAALERLVAACRHDTVAGGTLHATVLHAQEPALARQLHTSLSRAVPGAETSTAPFSSVMVAHTGPGLVGLAWWWEAPSSATASERPTP